MSTDSLVTFFQNYQVLAIAIVVVFVIFVYLKPKLTFQFMAALLVIGAIGYVISFLIDLTSTGAEQTKTFMSNPER